MATAAIDTPQQRTGLAIVVPLILAAVATAGTMGLLLLFWFLQQAYEAAQETGQRSTEFIWRRLDETPETFSYLGFTGMLWLTIGGALLLLGFFLIYRVYIRDGNAVGWRWGTFLAALRSLTVVALFFIWLLPAVRTVEFTEQRSRVVIIFDVSGSKQSSDEPPSDDPGQYRPTRQELVLASLFAPATTGTREKPVSPGQDEKLALLAGLAKRNPVFAYRFGEQLDELPRFLEQEQEIDRLDWAPWLQPALRPTLAQPVFNDVLDQFRKAGRELRKAEDSINSARDPQQRQQAEAARERRHKEIVENLERAIAENQQLHELLLNRTNLGKALIEVLRKESGNPVQGLIVVSDGRNNAGSTKDIEEAVGLAKKSGIPVFTVGVGEHRDSANLRLVDVLAPGQVQPEDEQWPVRVAVEGENLPRNQEVRIVLSMERPNMPKVDLEQKAVLTETTTRLANATAEFVIKQEKPAIKGDWKFRARVVPVKGERARADNVSESQVTVKVVDRKLSVLLFTSGALRDFTFARTVLFREKDRFDLSIHYQDADVSKVVLDVEPKRLLDRFPTVLKDRDEDPMNLGNYDVVVAFDPDWSKLDDSLHKNIQRWVEDFAGGLVVVAGPIHTFTLAREKELEIIRAVYPVILDKQATSFDVMDRSTKEPWALNWGPAATQMPFLDLRDPAAPESADKTKILEGWEQFFEVPRDASGAAERSAKRGFFSFFPVTDAKPGAQILARFSDKDPKSMTPKGQRQPYFVLSNPGKGQVLYMGSGEIWRLRAFNEKFHERFWTKLCRHMGRGDPSRGTRRGLLVVGNRYFEGDTVEVEAQLLDIEMKPLRPDPNTKVRLQVTPPEGMADAPKEWTEGLEMPQAPGRPGWFTGRFQVRRSGKYGLSVLIPGTRETLTGSFRVESIDVERDRTRPDFALLHRIAGEVREQTGADVREIRPLDEKKRADFLKAVAKAKDRMKLQAKEAPPGTIVTTSENEADRLFFELDSAYWIAECIDSKVIPFRSEGKAEDIWDKGWNVFWDLQHPEKASLKGQGWLEATWEERLTSGIPWALALVVLLLSAEWLTRKLLTLA